MASGLSSVWSIMRASSLWLRLIIQLLFLKKTSYSVLETSPRSPEEKSTQGVARDRRIFEERGTSIWAGAEAQGQELGESVRRTVYPFCLRLAWATASRSRPS